MMDTHTNRLINALKADVLFSFKHGFFTVYIVITVMYIVLLGLFDQTIVQTALPIIVYTDPSVFGLFFIGGMVMLEKQQGILALLCITPLRVREYIVSKLLSLCLISVFASVVITLVCYQGRVNYALLLISVALSSIFYTLIGFLISIRAKSVNDYLVKIIPWMVLLILPCLSLIPNSLIPTFVGHVFCVVPSVAGLKLVFASISPISFWQVALCTLSLVIMNVALLIKTQRIFTHKVMVDS